MLRPREQGGGSFSLDPGPQSLAVGADSGPEGVVALVPGEQRVDVECLVRDEAEGGVQGPVEVEVGPMGSSEVRVVLNVHSGVPRVAVPTTA